MSERPRSDGCVPVTEEQRSSANVGRPAAEHGQVTLAYAVRLYPTAIKAWALGALCELYRRQFNEQLDWCGQQEKLSFKGLAQAGTGEFAQRTKRQAIIALKRSRKADQAVKRDAPFTANRLVRAAGRAKLKGNDKKAARLLNRAEHLARRIKTDFQPPYLRATTTLLPHAETQEPRRSKSFDGWIHLEGTTREWQVYLPYRRHKAINRALAYEGAELAASAEVFFKNGKWYGRLFVNIPMREPKQARGWLGCDVGVRAAVTRSDGRRERPIDRKIQQRADRQRNNHRWRPSRSFQKQALDVAARRAVSVALRTGQGLALEDPARLPPWKGWAARHFGERVALLSSLEAIPVAYVAPPYTSLTCSHCGAVSKRNRRGTWFRCVACGSTRNADHNASRVVAVKAPVSGPVSQNHRAGSHAKRTCEAAGIPGIVALLGHHRW